MREQARSISRGLKVNKNSAEGEVFLVDFPSYRTLQELEPFSYHQPWSIPVSRVATVKPSDSPSAITFGRIPIRQSVFRNVSREHHRRRSLANRRESTRDRRSDCSSPTRRCKRHLGCGVVATSRTCRKRVPAQPVDATLSNQADPQNAYPEESICLADVAKPSQGKVPADLILASSF
jgi:hypothetical protein